MRADSLKVNGMVKAEYIGADDTLSRRTGEWLARYSGWD